MERLLDCWFLKTTGIPCPGCGMTRAYLAFFHGDIKEAFHFHPLFWLVPFIFVFSYWSYRKSSNKRYSKIYFGFALLFFGVYLFRMYTLFPLQEPLAFDQTALIPRIVAMFK